MQTTFTVLYLYKLYCNKTDAVTTIYSSFEDNAFNELFEFQYMPMEISV